MTDYVCGCKHKAGIVTLMLACVFAAGWVRSIYYLETIEWRSNSILCGAASVDQTFLVGMLPHHEQQSWSIIPEVTSEKSIPFSQVGRAIDWRWNLLSVRVGVGGKGEEPPWGYRYVPTHIAIPYVSIVIPLTMLSAWLLLSNLREKKPTSKPTHS